MNVWFGRGISENLTDYRSYAVCIPNMVCYVVGPECLEQRDAPNSSGRLVSFMVYARKLGRREEEEGKSGLGEQEEMGGGTEGSGRRKGEGERERRREGKGEEVGEQERGKQGEGGKG